MATVYVPDQVDGEALEWMVFPAGQSNSPTAVAVGGIQTLRFNHDYPSRIATEAGPNRKKRFQNTDTDSVTWSAGMLTIYKQDFATIMGLPSNPSVDYGALQWDKYVFDFTVNFTRTDDTGAIVQLGGWTVRNARLTTYAVDLGSPYDIVMTNVNGIAFASVPIPWA